MFTLRVVTIAAEPDKSVRAMKANRSAHCSTDGLRLKIHVHHSTPEGCLFTFACISFQIIHLDEHSNSCLLTHEFVFAKR